MSFAPSPSLHAPMSGERVTVSVEDAQRPFYVGVDVGGTSIKIGFVDDQGRTVAWRTIPTTQERGTQDAVDRIAAQVKGIAEEHGLQLDDIQAIGLGTPGTMDIPTGMILEPPNMPAWRYFPIRDRLAEQIGRPVAFANDAGAAAFGEFWVGSGRALSSIVMLTLGTGVGGGIILSGGLSLDGEHSHGSECGHIIIDSGPNARLCSCGQAGHLEAYASATGVAKRLAEFLESSDDPSSLRGRVEAGEELSTLMLAEEAEAGDSLSRRFVLETADYLAIAVTTLAHIIDPGGVILGGAMDFGGHETGIGTEFLDRIRSRFQQRTFPTLAERVKIDFASLGSDAGYLGAAGLARAAFRP